MGKKFRGSVEDFLVNDDDEKVLKKHFDINEEKIKEDFKKKIAVLTKFYKELNQNYGFSKFNKNVLIKKVLIF